MTRNLPHRHPAAVADESSDTVQPMMDNAAAAARLDLVLAPSSQTSSQPPTPKRWARSKGRKVPLAHGRSNEDFRPRDFAKPFCRFLSNNPTVFHAVDRVGQQLCNNGFTKISEREQWNIEAGKKYYLERNGSSLIAFAVGKDYKPGNGISMIAGHVDALTVKVKPIPGLQTKEGYVQLGVAPYAGGLNSTWWDRDLGIAGKVLVKEENGKIVTKLVNLNEPIARIPTLAPHFGEISQPPFNKETQMVPIIGLDDTAGSSSESASSEPKKVGDTGSFAATQPPQLTLAICEKLDVKDYNSIINWELELYDVQPATVGGLRKELIYGGRIDDKLCSWAAIQALLASCHDSNDPDAEATRSSSDASFIKMVALFDNEEIGSLTRQGARSDFLSSTISRAVESLHASNSSVGPAMSIEKASFTNFAQTSSPTESLARTYANSFLLSADVTHAYNPNFPSAYLPNHSPRLNTGLTISYDSNGHMSTDAHSTAFMQEIARRSKSRLQAFQIRNDVRSGGTIGPMTAAKLGVRSIDVGIVQLSMHSIRATTGADDPGLGVQAFRGFFDYFQSVDASFA